MDQDEYSEMEIFIKQLSEYGMHRKKKSINWDFFPRSVMLFVAIKETNYSLIFCPDIFAVQSF